MTPTSQHTAEAVPSGSSCLDAGAFEPLIACLDAQIDLLNRREVELDSLSEAIIANDNERMEHVLDEMTRSRQLQQQADADLQAERAGLAHALGWPERQTRLANLVELAEADCRQRLRLRRREVLERAARISLKHRQTAVLLAECTRINRMLIDCMAGTDRRVTLYGQGGAQHWQGDGGLMDTER